MTSRIKFVLMLLAACAVTPLVGVGCIPSNYTGKVDGKVKIEADDNTKQTVEALDRVVQHGEKFGKDTGKHFGESFRPLNNSPVETLHSLKGKDDEIARLRLEIEQLKREKTDAQTATLQAEIAALNEELAKAKANKAEQPPDPRTPLIRVWNWNGRPVGVSLVKDNPERVLFSFPSESFPEFQGTQREATFDESSGLLQFYCVDKVTVLTKHRAHYIAERDEIRFSAFPGLVLVRWPAK